MKSGNTNKLLISRDQSDISSQYHSINQHEGSFWNNQGPIKQQYQEDEANIDMLIRKSEALKKISKNEGFIPKKDSLDEKGIKNDVSLSIAQSRTITLDGQNHKKKAQNLQFNMDKYEFKMENSKQAIKNLRISEVHGPSVIFQKRGKVIDTALIKTQNQIQIQNIPIYFPYKPYEIQKQYMSAVIKALNNQSNALLQSPTGTGKTLCLLSSVLSWAHHYNSQNIQKITVIYCSRTHTQLRQVQSELQKTCFRPTMSNFGSRDQFCIKKQFSAIKGRDLMQSCSKAVKLYLKQKRKLELDNEDEVMVRNEMIHSENEKQQAHICHYYKSESDYLRILQNYYQNKIVTSQMIKEEGERHHFCPYYYAFQVKQKADLIFMPYNYILDVDRLPNYQSIIKNSVIILDEAHNVPEAACEGRTFMIYSNIFTNIEAELKKLEYNSYMSAELKQVAYSFQSTRQLLQKECKHLRNKMDLLANNVHNRKRPTSQLLAFDDKFDIQQIFKPQDLKIMIINWFGAEHYEPKQYQSLSRDRQKQLHVRTVTHLNKIIKQTNDLIEALKETYDGIFQNLQKLNSFIQKCSDLLSEFGSESASDWWTKQVNHYRLCVKCIVKQGVFLYEIKLVCLTPSLTFNDLAKYKPRSILLTSGTLSPLDSWQKQLNFPFSVKLMNKHVIEKEQLHLGIVCKSKNNESTFNFSYNQLQNNPNIYKSLLKTVIYICSKVNNGVLIIFPSYKIISTFKDLLSKDANSLAELQKTKNICFEDRGTVDHIIMNFKSKARTTKGAALFCVCRGKVSEGLDFSDQLCRAVVFIGVPFPNIKDPILKQKRDYYDRLSGASKNKGVLSLTGDEWYTLSTMRAVNQGIGRVIRHINDYGLILMLDNRYDQPKLRNMLPYWAKENMCTYIKFEQIDAKIQRFYTEMKQKFPTKYIESSQPEQQNAYLKKQRPKEQDKRVSKQKQDQKQPQRNFLDIIMAGRNSKGERKKSKKKQLDFY